MSRPHTNLEAISPLHLDDGHEGVGHDVDELHAGVPLEEDAEHREELLAAHEGGDGEDAVQVGLDRAHVESIGAEHGEKAALLHPRDLRQRIGLGVKRAHDKFINMGHSKTPANDHPSEESESERRNFFLH